MLLSPERTVQLERLFSVEIHLSFCVVKMFIEKSYFGFTGTTLNVAIGVLAGLDFLLFGYDQGVMGGLLDLPSFVRSAGGDGCDGFIPA